MAFPTTATETIGVGSGIGTPTYSLFSTVVTDLQSAGWTQNLTLEVLWASSANEIDQGFDLTGATHNNYTFTLTAAAGDSFVDNANFGTNRLAYLNSNGACLKQAVRFRSSNVKSIVTRLQIWGASSTYYGLALAGTSIYSMDVENCIIEAPGANSVVGANSSWTTPPQVKNCVLITNGGNGFDVASNYGQSGKMYNCTVYNRGAAGSTYGFENSAYGSTNTVYNCVFIGFNNNVRRSGGTGSHNATSKASADNLQASNIVLSVVAADAFVDVGASTYDLRLKSGSALINVGTGSFGPSTDIGGQSRVSTTDIGAYEFQTAPSIIFNPLRGPLSQGGYVA